MEEIDLKELLQIVWEEKIQIILITAIFIALGLIYSIGFVTPKYEAKTKLLLATNAPTDRVGTETITTTDVTLNSKLVSTYSVLVKSDKIIRTVISNLGLAENEASIRNNVSVATVSDAEVIEIKVKNENPKLAAEITNEMAKVFIENIKEFYGMENVHVVDPAETPAAPYNINHMKNVVIFAFVGIVVSGMYVLVVNMLDTTIKSEEDIEKITGFTVLATFPYCESFEEKNKSKKMKKGGKRK